MPLKKVNAVDNIYYIENCLSPAFESIKRQRVSSGLRGIKLLHDYSSDLAPFDPWLFDYIKQRFEDENDANSLLRSMTKKVNVNIIHIKSG